MTSFKVQELFRDDAPVLVFGGPYSNLHATRAMRAEAARLGIPPDHVICTGDVVAYCGDPLATVNEIRDWGCHVLAGNCEKQLAAGALDCGCGFEEGTTCDLLSVAWYAFASAQLDAQARAWMADLPDALAFGHAGRACLALHGGVTDVARFLFEASPEAEFAEELAALPAQPDWVLAGHCGIPFQRQIGDVAWINAGVIGMPPHDGGRDTRFALLEGGRVLQHALGYDWRTAQDSMVAAGLAQGYHLALETGVWPSEDVLPQAMRRG
jgi:predicted phosphodiesterase